MSNIKTIRYNYSQYVGGLSGKDKKHLGYLNFTSEAIGVRNSLFNKTPKHGALKWTDVASIDITGQQTASSRLGATLLFGEIGALAASGSRNQVAVVVHTKDNRTAYYLIGRQNPVAVKAKLTPFLQAVGVPFTEQVATQPLASAADELEKLARLKEQGIITQAEFEAKKK
jgi:hypothetical protein